MKYRGTSLLVQRMVFSVLQNFLCAVQMPKVQKKNAIKNLTRLEETPQNYSIFIKEKEKHYSLSTFLVSYSLSLSLPESFPRVPWKK